MPFGLAGTLWSYRSLREIGVRSREPIDWPGNVAFAAGVVLVMVGILAGGVAAAGLRGRVEDSYQVCIVARR